MIYRNSYVKGRMKDETAPKTQKVGEEDGRWEMGVGLQVGVRI